MSTINLCFRPSSVAGRVGALYFRVSHRRTTARLHTGYYIYPDEWDAGSGAITPRSASLWRRPVLNAFVCDIRAMRTRLDASAATLNAAGASFCAADIISHCQRHHPVGVTLFEYIKEVAVGLKANGQYATHRHYMATLHSVEAFAGGHGLSLVDVTPQWAAAYERHLLTHCKVCLNTSSFYMRCLRAVYNRAVGQGLVDDRRPFAHVYTGVAATRKRSIGEASMCRLCSVNLDGSPALSLARDIFIMSYCLRGMSLIDMARLKDSDIKDGRLEYSRSKTRQHLSVGWQPCMQTIVDRYRHLSAGGMLLPIVRHPAARWHQQYTSASVLVNRHLHRLGQMIGLQQPLTMYCARHTWATMAHAKGVPLETISEALGHDNASTTRIYMGTINHSAVDAANNMIIKDLEKRMVSLEET